MLLIARIVHKDVETVLHKLSASRARVSNPIRKSEDYYLIVPVRSEHSTIFSKIKLAKAVLQSVKLARI